MRELIISKPSMKSTIFVDGFFVSKPMKIRDRANPKIIKIRVCTYGLI